MSLPSTFNDILDSDENGNSIVILAQNILENGDRITIPASIVEIWLANPDQQNDAVKTYLTQWGQAGRI